VVVGLERYYNVVSLFLEWRLFNYIGYVALKSWGIVSDELARTWMQVVVTHFNILSEYD
jgi:hypothetical protein